MSVIRLRTTTKNSMLQALADAIDAGSGSGTIELYTDSMPTTPETAVSTQTLLGTLTFSKPCGVVSDGALTMSAITQDSEADATGTAAWARVSDSDGNAQMDIDASTTGGTGALQLNTTNIVSGGPLLISSFVISL